MDWAFGLISGLWGLAMVVNLILAIRLCYRIEALSPRWARKPGALPAYAAWLPVMLNYGVSRDPGTQALRRRMNLHFAAVPVGFVVFYLFLRFAGAA